MADWRSQKAEAQLAVHRQFALCATYTPPGVGASPVLVHVRHHTRVATYGDLDREGFAQTVDDINAVIFDSCEAAPEKRGVIEFDDGRRYKIDLVQPAMGRFVRCDVAGLKSA